MKPVTLLKGTVGLNNIFDPLRIKDNYKSDMCELAEAYNVDIDSSGRVSRRKGWTITSITEDCHSIFCDGGDCLFVSGGSLYRLNKDYSRTGIRSGLSSGRRMSYCQVASDIYYTNGCENGYVRGDISYVWYAKPYVGPATTKIFNDPPLSTLIEAHSSRIYAAVRNGIEYSEPFSYGWFSSANNFIALRSTPSMLRSVVDGIYVGLDDSVIFLSGRNPTEFEYNVVSNYPILVGTDVKIDGKYLNKNVTGKCIMWTSKDGIYVGLPGGQIDNLTKDKLIYPSKNVGCAVCKDNKYITLMK